MYQEILNKPVIQTLRKCADENNIECYLVGGCVRDVFLNRENKDIDVVVLGNGIFLAERFRDKLGDQAHLSIFKNFGTAQVKLNNLEIEFVGARKESYRLNSRKPTVSEGTLEDDQRRRDFTINAMAIGLTSEN